MGLFDIFKRSAPKTPSAPTTPAVAESAQAAATGAAGAAAATAAATVASAAPPEATAAAAVPAVPAVEVADADVESVVAEELAGFSGGLTGLLDKVKEGGLGDIADSWVSKGENLGISADQVKSLMDPERLKGIAAQAGHIRRHGRRQAGRGPARGDRQTHPRWRGAGPGRHRGQTDRLHQDQALGRLLTGHTVGTRRASRAGSWRRPAWSGRATGRIMPAQCLPLTSF